MYRKFILALLFVFFTVPGCGLIKSGRQATVEPTKESTDKIEAPKSATATKKTTEKKQAKPEKVCGIVLTGSADKAAQAYYVKAERAFNNDDVTTAKKILETAVCLDPAHTQAKDLSELLRQTYP